MARILVVDDEESIRDLLDTVLTRKGHEVILADGGRKGVELFRKKHPQLTILDLLMPDLNGIDVLKSIRAHDEQAHVIILTGYATAEAVAMARTLGVTDVLNKEFSLHELGDGHSAGDRRDLTTPAGKGRLPVERRLAYLTRGVAGFYPFRRIAIVIVKRAPWGRLREAWFTRRRPCMAAEPTGPSTIQMESERARLYVQIVTEILAMRACLPALAAHGDAGRLELQGHRLLEMYGRYIALVEDHTRGAPPSAAERQRREKQWAYLLHKWHGT